MVKFKVVKLNEIRRFMQSCLEIVGIKESHATDLIDVLIQADIRGHYSHGLNRLSKFNLFFFLIS